MLTAATLEAAGADAKHVTLWALMFGPGPVLPELVLSGAGWVPWSRLAEHLLPPLKLRQYVRERDLAALLHLRAGALDPQAYCLMIARTFVRLHHELE